MVGRESAAKETTLRRKEIRAAYTLAEEYLREP